MKPARSRRHPKATPGKKPDLKPVQARPRHQDKSEEKFHGVRACEALFARRPQDIIRVYVTADRRRQFGDLLEYCARERKGFQVVEPENLERLTGSIHHEGIAILARQLRRWDLSDLLREIDSGRLVGPLLHLDGVQNPHNLGSILRTAAHFGVAAVLGATGGLPPLSPAAVRVAEGAAESVPVCDLADPVADLKRLKKAGYRIATTSSHRGDLVHSASLDGRLVLVLGSEGGGISKPIDALADLRLKIPGTGAVESLNVSVACGILLGEIWRRGQPR
jgi:TrmH RNA methyltransferase